MATREASVGASSDEGRFEWGKNWQNFLSVLNDERIELAEESLRRNLAVDDLRGKTFIDVGSGSGLFSLCALRLGAERVHSFDYDPDSVAATTSLREQMGSDKKRWTVEHGSAMDEAYLDGLGQWDVAYSWGVLHHTGDVWKALDNVERLVKPGGQLYIALYNDQGMRSRVWTHIKRIYNRLPQPLRLPFLLAVAVPRELVQLARATVLLHPHHYIRTWTDYRSYSRGMSRWHDIVDWVGGYPFEVTKPDDVFAFYRERGYSLTSMTTLGAGSGCNEFVFRKSG